MPMTAEYFQHDVDAAEARGRAEVLAKVRAAAVRHVDDSFSYCRICLEGWLKLLPERHRAPCPLAEAHAETPED